MVLHAEATESSTCSSSTEPIIYYASAPMGLLYFVLKRTCFGLKNYNLKNSNSLYFYYKLRIKISLKSNTEWFVLSKHYNFCLIFCTCFIEIKQEVGEFNIEVTDGIITESFDDSNQVQLPLSDVIKQEPLEITQETDPLWVQSDIPQTSDCLQVNLNLLLNKHSFIKLPLTLFKVFIQDIQ